MTPHRLCPGKTHTKREAECCCPELEQAEAEARERALEEVATMPLPEQHKTDSFDDAEHDRRVKEPLRKALERIVHVLHVTPTSEAYHVAKSALAADSEGKHE